MIDKALKMTENIEDWYDRAEVFADIASVLLPPHDYDILASLVLEWPDVLLPNLAQELSATLSVSSVGSSFKELLVVFSGREDSIKVEPDCISFLPLRSGSTIKRRVEITPLRPGQVPLGIRIEGLGISLKRDIRLVVAPILPRLLAPHGEIVEGGRFLVPFEVELTSRVEITALKIAYEREALKLLKMPDLRGAAGPGKLRGSVIFEALRPGELRLGPLVVRTPDYEVPSELLTIHVRPARPELSVEFEAPGWVRPGEELRLTAKVRCVRGKALGVVPSFEPGDAWAPLLVQEEAIGDMGPGEEATLEFVLIALREGRSSPGKLVLSYSDLEGKEYRLEQEAPEISVSRIQRPVAPRERRRPARAEARPVSIPLKPRRIVALPLSIKLAPISPKPLEKEELALRLGRVEFWDAEALGPMPEGPSVELKGLIGSGGLSIVYLGSIAGRGVAVKVPLFPRPWRTLERSEQEALLAEAELMTKLKHPNIVAVLAYGTSPWAWVALELMEGGSLRAILDQHYSEGLPIRETVLMGIQLADALEHGVHHYGIVHRDIKPGNVLFTADGIPKLADLGLAKLMMRSSRGGEVKGTPAYLAPEQVDPGTYGEVDWRTDIWQLSLTLYEALTGRNPFMAPSPVEIQARVVSVQPKKPSDIRPDVPKSLDEVLLTGLAKEKEDRYETAEGLRRALLAVLEEELSHG
ncbi:hypothetical protein DRO32_05055 [Candidatus Bathyarchaeota archaeon]|nr:MAG: hypothetical protein DRO32_05055 [Candidatus Bathyarchaeota archaeon]